MLQHSPKYDPTIHAELDKADWDAVSPEGVEICDIQSQNVQVAWG